MERDELVRRMLEFVGTTEWLYIASTCRRWRGLYFSLRVKECKAEDMDLTFQTTWAAAVITANRLQYAFDHGLNVEQIHADMAAFAGAVCKHSLEPIPAMTVARVRGVSWHEELCSEAASRGCWAFLRWLKESGCPWLLREVYFNAMNFGQEKDALSILPWIKERTVIPLSADELRSLMFDVGGYSTSEFVE